MPSLPPDIFSSLSSLSSAGTAAVCATYGAKDILRRIGHEAAPARVLPGRTAPIALEEDWPDDFIMNLGYIEHFSNLGLSNPEPELPGYVRRLHQTGGSGATGASAGRIGLSPASVALLQEKDARRGSEKDARRGSCQQGARPQTGPAGSGGMRRSDGGEGRRDSGGRAASRSISNGSFGVSSSEGRDEDVLQADAEAAITTFSQELQGPDQGNVMLLPNLARSPSPLQDFGGPARPFATDREVWVQLAEERREQRRQRQRLLCGMKEMPFEEWYQQNCHPDMTPRGGRKIHHSNTLKREVHIGAATMEIIESPLVMLKHTFRSQRGNKSPRHGSIERGARRNTPVMSKKSTTRSHATGVGRHGGSSPTRRSSRC